MAYRKPQKKTREKKHLDKLCAISKSSKSKRSDQMAKLDVDVLLGAVLCQVAARSW